MSSAAGITYNPLLPAVRRDPYPTYRALRRADPVHRSLLMDTWVLTRYDDVSLLLRDQRLSVERQRWKGFQALDGQAPVASMLVVDPPYHTRLRALVSRAFTPRTVERLRPRIEAFVNDALDRAESRGGLELIGDLAYPLPVTVIAEMLGVPSADWPRFRAWSRALVAALDPLSARAAGAAGAALAAREALGGYLSEIVALRRAEPAEDLITALLLLDESGEGLTHLELVVMANLLLVAGHETTVNLIGNGVLALLRHPEQLASLRERPELIRPAVEELLRFDSPVQLTARVALEPFEMGAQEIQAGDMLIALLGSANRDGGQFSDPDRLDLGREPNPHLSFGRGIHFCLGASLARLEAQVAIGALVSRFPRLRLQGTVRRSPTVTLRGVRRLPLSVG
ncbi:cytochrome P450 [Candidatus Nephthysia bennettiae]